MAPPPPPPPTTALAARRYRPRRDHAGKVVYIIGRLLKYKRGVPAPAKIGNRIKTAAALSGPESMKQTNKLEAVPAHRERRTDKSLRTLAQMRTACILHSQFGMTRFIGLHRPTSFPPSFSVSTCAFLRIVHTRVRLPIRVYIYIYRFVRFRGEFDSNFRVVPNCKEKRKGKKYTRVGEKKRNDHFSINLKYINKLYLSYRNPFNYFTKRP